MATFHYSFTVAAPPARVAAFYFAPGAFKTLTPPLVRLDVHRAEPLAEGSVLDFTLWFGPWPVRWTAVHSAADPARGFTDTQAKGPMRAWVHTHAFTGVGNGLTLVSDTIAYAHHAGLSGLASRLLFSRPGLYLWFRYREWALRRSICTPGSG